VTDPSAADRRIAVLIDFENLAMSFPPDSKETFDIHRVLGRLLEKGKVVAKVAYADWSRFGSAKEALHEAGIELIEIPRRKTSGKNSADIRLVVDAMDLSYAKEHIDTFVIVSGDSDFSPLVGKLKENGKSVIGLGMRDSTSKLLADNCDEFIYYEDLGGASPPLPAAAGTSKIPREKQEAYTLLFDSIRALQREGHDILHASRIKETMKRKQPSFSETAYGYRSFSELLEEAKEGGFLELRMDDASGTYVVAQLKTVKTARRRRRGGATGARGRAPRRSPPSPGTSPA
jgi:uncharacterized protein (TIGR00288 family)